MEFDIWKNDNKRREILWKNDIMKNAFECFKKFQELGFEDRIGQQDMSFDIIDAISEGQNMIVEASVGIGKSYAYLIPLMYYHKLTKKPFIISTSTITLQEQIEKDILKLSELLDIPINIVIAKGKCNYLCRNNLCLIKNREIKKKFSNLRNNLFLNDRANVDDISDTEWNKICVNKCKFNHCSYYFDCCFIKKREEMRTTMGAIICNHDLLLENQKRIVDEKNILLSPSEVIVIDEAHSLEEKTRNSYRKTFSAHQIRENLRKSVKLLRNVGYPFSSYEFNEIDAQIEELFNIIKEQTEKEIQNLIKRHIILSSTDTESYKFNYTYQIKNITQLLYKKIDKISSIVQIYDRRNDDESISDILLDIVDMFRELSKGTDSDLLFWIEKCNKNYIIVNCPKNINERTKNILFNDLSSIKILTSATLNTDFEEENYYRYFMQSVGLCKDKKLFITPPIESAFDIANNTLLYYSNDIAHPQKNHSKYIEDITKRIIDLVKITEGKSLILFTAKADMKQVYNNLIKEKLPYKILIQKDGASQIKTKEEFSKDINSILLSTGTFWEGIDIKGKSLSSVIIVRLPFPISNPVIEYKTSISNNIMDVCLPEMLIKLKQGIGRLIRCDTDKGIIAILDSRIGDLSKVSYKDMVFNSIKSKIKTNNLDIVKKFVKEKGIVN